MEEKVEEAKKAPGLRCDGRLDEKPKNGKLMIIPKTHPSRTLIPHTTSCLMSTEAVTQPVRQLHAHTRLSQRLHIEIIPQDRHAQKLFPASR